MRLSGSMHTTVHTYIRTYGQRRWDGLGTRPNANSAERGAAIAVAIRDSHGVHLSRGLYQLCQMSLSPIKGTAFDSRWAVAD